MRRLGAWDGEWRVAPLGREAVVVGNAGYLLGMSLSVGLDPLLPRRYAELVALINGQPVAAFENLVVFLDDTPSPLWPLLNARQRLVPRGAQPGGSTPSYVVEDDARALPRALALGDVRLVGSAQEAPAALTALGFDPGAMAVLEASTDG